MNQVKENSNVRRLYAILRKTKSSHEIDGSYFGASLNGVIFRLPTVLPFWLVTLCGKNS